MNKFVRLIIRHKKNEKTRNTILFEEEVEKDMADIVIESFKRYLTGTSYMPFLYIKTIKGEAILKLSNIESIQYETINE